MLSRPSLMPKVSSANSRSKTSAPGVECGCGNAHRLRLRLLDAAGAFGSHEPKRAREGGFHVTPVDHEIEHPALDEEFTALESLGKLLPDRLLDDARACEPDQRLG